MSEMMTLAMEQAEMARYSSSPRPWVGCIIRSHDKIFTGFTQGELHAEQDALKKAGKDAQGAKLFTTLEPCLHKCVPEIIEAGIEKVIVGVTDPDKKVSGKGMVVLKDAGIRIEVGVMADEIREQLEPYIFQRVHKRPFVVLKLAATLDGRIGKQNRAIIADKEGLTGKEWPTDREWITGKEARIDVHRIRAENDAVIVGSATFLADSPKLDARNFKPKNRAEINQPQPIVLSTTELSETFSDGESNFMKMSGKPKKILTELYKKGMLQVLIEGGSTVAADFHSAGLIDKYIIYYAPTLFADDSSMPMFNFEKSAERFGKKKKAKKGKLLNVQVLGNDIKVEMKFGDWKKSAK